MKFLDEPYIKLLLLIIPALVSVLVLFFDPIIKDKTFKNSLIGKKITVLVILLNDLADSEELYETSGIIQKINEDVLEVKRKTQPNFRIPFIKTNFISNLKSNSKSNHVSIHYIKSEKELDINMGILINK